MVETGALTGPCYMGPMPSKLATPSPSQTYQRFAWVTLALAGMVALFSTDREEPAPQSFQASAVSGTAGPAPAKMATAQFNPSVPPAMAEAEADEGGEPVAVDDGQPEAGTSANPAAEPQPEKGPGAGPTAGEAGQLLAKSRNRSGATDQGDEPIRLPAG